MWLPSPVTWGLRSMNDSLRLTAHIIAGYPDLETTSEIIKGMSEAGADMIILEIPFSDPIAGGPEIQGICSTALSSGVTTDSIFDMLVALRKNCGIMISVMTYYNPIFVYGADAFMKRCAEARVHHIIVPDVPMEEKGELEPTCRKNGISMISMVAPTTKQRMEAILDNSEEIVYVMRPNDASGYPDDYIQDPREICGLAHSKGLRCIIDSGRGEASDVLSYADGAVDGEDIMTIVLRNGKDCVQFVSDYVRGVRGRV